MNWIKKGTVAKKKIVRKVNKTIEPKVEEPEEKVKESEEKVEEETEVEEEVKEETESTPQEDTIWSVEEIPTATTPVIYNSKTKEELNLYQAIAEILNRTED